MLLGREAHSLACEAVDCVRDSIVPYREEELLGNRAREHDHVELAFPGLAYPAFIGEFLHDTHALPRGVAPGEGQPSPRGCRGDDDENQNYNRGVAAWSFMGDGRSWAGLVPGTGMIAESGHGSTGAKLRSSSHGSSKCAGRRRRSRGDRAGASRRVPAPPSARTGSARRARCRGRCRPGRGSRDPLRLRRGNAGRRSASIGTSGRCPPPRPTPP